MSAENPLVQRNSRKSLLLGVGAEAIQVGHSGTGLHKQVRTLTEILNVDTVIPLVFFPDNLLHTQPKSGKKRRRGLKKFG